MKSLIMKVWLVPILNENFGDFEFYGVAADTKTKARSIIQHANLKRKLFDGTITLSHIKPLYPNQLKTNEVRQVLMEGLVYLGHGETHHYR